MSMSPSVEAQYRAAIRKLLREKGRPVKIVERERERWPETPEAWTSTFGWEDTDAQRHCSPKPEGYHRDGVFEDCSWVIPEEGVQVDEVAYSGFVDTMSDNSETIGINAYGGKAGDPSNIHCACGKYTGVTLRHEASLYSIMVSVLGLDRKSMAI